MVAENIQSIGGEDDQDSRHGFAKCAGQRAQMLALSRVDVEPESADGHP
jgi:hypothetical protein